MILNNPDVQKRKVMGDIEFGEKNEIKKRNDLRKIDEPCQWLSRKWRRKNIEKLIENMMREYENTP